MTYTDPVERIGKLRVYATHAVDHPETPWNVDAHIYFAEGDSASRDAFVASFPKSAKLIPTTLSTHERGDWRNGRPISMPVVCSYIRLASDGANGGRNETGIKRYRAILKKAAALGVPIEWITPTSNSYPTQADFEETL